MNHKTYKSVLSLFFFHSLSKTEGKKCTVYFATFCDSSTSHGVDTCIFFVIKLEYKDIDKP